MLSGYISNFTFAGAGLQGQQSPIFMVFLCIKLFVISISHFTYTFAGSDLQGQQSPVVSIISFISPGCVWPFRQHVNFIKE